MPQDDIDQFFSGKANASAGASQGVAPSAAMTAIKSAPLVGVDPEIGMHDPEGVGQLAREKGNQAILDASPPLQGFVGSSPAKAAAVGNDFGSLAGLARTVNKWNDTANADFLAPGQAAVDALKKDLSRYGSPESFSLLKMIPGMSQRDQTLGSIAGDVAGIVFSPFSGAANVAARPLSYLPTYKDEGGKAVRKSQPEAQQDIANILMSAFSAGKAPEAGIARAPPIDEGFGVQPRLNSPIPRPGSGSPAADATHSLLANINAAHVAEMEKGVTAVSTHAEAPELTHDFLHNHTPAGEATAWVDPEKVAEIWNKGDQPFSAHVDDFEAAMRTGSDVPVPMSTYLTEVAGKPFADDLRNSTRFSEDGVSVDQAKDLGKDEPSIFKDNVPLIPDNAEAPEGTAQAFTPNGEVYVVKPNTTDPEEVKALLPLAQQFGGRYAMGRADMAFQFKSPEARDLFLRELNKAPSTTPTIPEDIGPEFHESIRELAARADDHVQQVFKENGLDTLFTEPKAAGLTKGLFERYGVAVDEARASVHERLMERTYKQIKRERSPDWKAALDLHMEEGLAAINAQANVVAYRALRDPMFKIDRDAVPEGLTLPDAIIKRGGLSPDEAAELAGYPTGKALLADMHNLNVAVQAHGGTLDAYIKNRARVYAEEKARAMVGYDVTPEGLLAAAREAVTEPKVEDLLIDALREVGERLGLPLDKESVLLAADEHFATLPLSDASKPRAFADNMKRLGDKAEKAIFDGKDVEAFKYKQQQLLQFHQLKMAFKLQKEVAKAQRQIRTVAKKPVNAGMDQVARNHLRKIAQDLGFSVRTGKYEGVESALRGQTLSDYGNVKLSQGLPVYITDVPAQFKDLTVAEFKDVYDMWKSISTLGREEMQVFSEGKKIALEEVVNEIKANATLVGRKYTATNRQLGKGTVQLSKVFEPKEFELLKRKITNAPANAMRTLGAASVRNETFLYWLDRESYGPLMKYVVTPLNERAGWKIQRTQEMGDAFRAFTKSQPKGWADSLNDKVDIPELTYGRDEDGAPIPWLRDKGMVIRAALHLGTEENWAKLTEGYGWDPQRTEQILKREMSPADWKYVQFLWDEAHKLWPETQTLYRATVGLAPREVVGRNITLPDGSKLKGRYWHLDYDWNALGENADSTGQVIDVKDPMALGNSDLFGENFRVATPPNGSVKQRTQFRGPLNLDHATLHREFESVIHDLAFRKELIQAAKLLRQPGVANAIREALGPEYLASTKQWLQDIARQANYDQTALKGLAGFFRGIRRRFTIVQIGFNVATVVKHGGIALFHMTGEGGLQLPQAIYDVHFGDRGHWQSFVDAHSSEVPNTLYNLDRDLREAMDETFRRTGAITTWQYYSTALFSVIKRVEAQATWLAKYRASAAEGLNDEAAFALADKSVRDTQGSGTAVNLAALQRGDGTLGSEALKLFNAFTTFMNTQTNRMWTVGRRNARMVDRIKNAAGGGGRGGDGIPIDGFSDEGWAGARRDFTKNMADLLSFSILPAVFLAMLDITVDGLTGKHQKAYAERLRGEFLHKFGEHLTQGLLGGTIPGGNTLAQVPRMVHNQKFDPGSDPLNEMLSSLAYTGFNAYEVAHGMKVHDQKWPTHAIETAGYLTGAPVKPIARSGQFWWDRETGKVKDSGPLGLLTATIFGNAAVKEHKSGGSSSAKHGTHHK